MKYILFDHDGMPAPVLFPDHLGHDFMWDKLRLPVMGAGFVDVRDGSVHGRSESLNLGPGANDTVIMRACLATNPIQPTKP